MSDDYVVIVPRDPRHVPTREVQERVTALLRQIAPQAASVTVEAFAQVRFFNCGQNFKRVECPECSSEVTDWWRNRMDDDYRDGGFRLELYKTPCCGALVTLNDLIYDWPQAFGSFTWTVMNPNIGELTQPEGAALAAAAGAPLVVVRQRI